MVGLDSDLAGLRFALNHSSGRAHYVAGDGGKLPFPDSSFDCTVSVTAPCFAGDQASFLSEMVRVTKRRFVLGLLNRTRLLYRDKGRQGGTGAYQGARWHTAHEIANCLDTCRWRVSPSVAGYTGPLAEKRDNGWNESCRAACRLVRFWWWSASVVEQIQEQKNDRKHPALCGPLAALSA